MGASPPAVRKSAKVRGLERDLFELVTSTVQA